MPCGKAQVLDFLVIYGSNRWSKIFIRTSFHLHKNNLTVALSNDVEFQVTNAPVAFQQRIAFANQEATRLFFAYLSEDVVGGHGEWGTVKGEGLKVKGEREEFNEEWGKLKGWCR